MDNDQDPNNDPEFVSLFTLTDSDEDEDSDEEHFPTYLRTSLSSIERAARVQQANRELFSKPYSKKKVKSKVQFDLVPQSINGDCVIPEGGEGESVHVEHESCFQRRDTKVVLPKRFSTQYNNTNTNKQQNSAQRPNQNQYHVPRSPRTPTREEQKTPDSSRSKEDSNRSKDDKEKQSSVQASQSQTQSSDEQRPRPSRSRQNTGPKPKTSKHQNPPRGDQKRLNTSEILQTPRLQTPQSRKPKSTVPKSGQYK